MHQDHETGIYVNVGLDDDGRPFVTINTEDIKPEFSYDDATLLLGTAEPYTVREDGEEAIVIDAADAIISRHFPHPNRLSARMAARAYAKMLNGEWAKRCGMPIVTVHLNDAEIYNAEHERNGEGRGARPYQDGDTVRPTEGDFPPFVIGSQAMNEEGTDQGFWRLYESDDCTGSYWLECDVELVKRGGE